MRTPDFENILAVLNNGKSKRATLFEFFLNENLIRKLAKAPSDIPIEWGECTPVVAEAFKNGGYDYATVLGCNIHFTPIIKHDKATVSLNESHYIYDRKSFENYDWPDPETSDYSRLANAQTFLPPGMKLIVHGRGGVLENVIRLTGYDNLCMMLMDDPQLVEDLFAAVGKRYLRYYEIASGFKTVGALMVNDDWGFKTQTMLSPDDLRKYVTGWHKKIVESIHKSNKPAILHCCGQLDLVMDDIIDFIGYDAKHSFEDSIISVEEAYAKWGKRIAILGGIDLDFICRADKKTIKDRCRKMLALSSQRGGYALGTGNSIPTYVPDDNYFAMTSTVFE